MRLSKFYFSRPAVLNIAGFILLTPYSAAQYFQLGICLSRKMTGIVKTFDRKSGKGFIIPSDGRKEVQVHISAFTPRDAEVLIPGLRVEFCRVNGLRGPTAANVYLS